tara:strand:+ start:534 stop:863 length:330 start_codon:yes stop_codon:yes gene_type:complete
VYTAEIDHIEKEDNQYNHNEGTFKKYVPALSKENGTPALSISHAQELHDALRHSYDQDLKCRLLLVKGTKWGTFEGGVRTAPDGDLWVVSRFIGTVAEGFEFVLERVSE